MSLTAAGHALDVIGFGAASVDSVYLLPGSPAPDSLRDKMRIDRHFVSCGGQVATALAVCASLGLRTKFIGAIGNDHNGKLLREALTARRVDVSGVVVHDAPNQHAVILIDRTTGERVILWDRHDGLQLDEPEWPSSHALSARLVHVDDVDPRASTHIARSARAAGAVVTSDIDCVTADTIPLFDAVTVAIVASHVPSALTGIDDAADALLALRARHAGLLCVTLGAKGAIALDGDRLVRQPGFAVDAIDTTGAGDVFRGGFIYGHLQGWPIDTTLRFANAAAAASCTRLGAMGGVPPREDIERLMATAGMSA